jgi:DNA-binding NtrC family response regulator
MVTDLDSSNTNTRTGGWTLGRDDSEEALRLLVHRGTDAYALPIAEGESIVIGRGRASNLVLREPTLSRRHARFERHDDSVWVKDLGSHNGTKIAGRRIEAAQRLELGEVATLGNLSVMLHYTPRTLTLGAGSRGHGRFVGALRAELDRAWTQGRAVAVMRLDTSQSSQPEAALLLVRDRLRSVDQIAVDDDDHVEVLLADVDETDVDRIAKGIVACAAGHELWLRCGVAVFPRDGHSAEELIASATRALEATDAEWPYRPASAVTTTDADASMISRSPKTREVFARARKVAQAAAPALIYGETGVGKELVARTVHAASDRSSGPLVSVDCGALAASVLPSELFGHEKGAFTDARERRRGVFEAAHGGTLFLDEIGELPLAAQAAFLRALETRTIRRVGGTENVPVDVRVVAATNRNLAAMCEQGTFRRDLYFRLNALTIEVPPLRERLEDIVPLAELFLAHAAASHGRPGIRIDASARALLLAHPWPGNVRELKHAMESALVEAEGTSLGASHLNGTLRAESPRLCLTQGGASSRSGNGSGGTKNSSSSKRWSPPAGTRAQPPGSARVARCG